MLQNILNLEGVAVLDKKQQALINGGNECRLYISGGPNGGYWSEPVSFEQATSDYNNSQEYNDGSTATGYCCASCGSFKNSPALN